MAELNLFIGNKGGGKTTLACYLAQYAHQTCPNVPIVTNTPIFFANIPEGRKRKLSEDLEEGKEIDVPHAILRRSSLKWLAVKTILKDTRYALMFPDEASLAEDLESRGSHAYSTAPRTWLIALSRKINVDLDMLRARKEYAELQRADFILEQTRKFVKRTEVKQEDVQDYKRDMGIRP